MLALGSVIFTALAGGGFYWILAVVGILAGSVLTLTGSVILKGPDAVSRLVSKKDKLS